MLNIRWGEYKKDRLKAERLVSIVDPLFEKGENINLKELDEVLFYFISGPLSSELSEVITDIDNWFELTDYVWEKLFKLLKQENISNEFRNKILEKVFETAFASQRYLCDTGNQPIIDICNHILEIDVPKKECYTMIIDIANDYELEPAYLILYLEKLNIICFK
jgi:hypothetical protein|uniref:Uncharacterized protein n=1 Tax=viral metagenome TaxID=1070528 RepID=A0A6C0J1Q5_9ZZZZ